MSSLSALLGQNVMAGPVNRAVNFSQVRDSLRTLWGEGNRASSGPSRYNQVYNWMDLMEQYEGRPLELESESFTASMLNERGNVMLSVVAPIIPTNENNFQINKTEIFMLPYDVTAAGGVPRTTAYGRETRNYSLKQFKRYFPIEVAYLQDPNYGRTALNNIVATLEQQATLTLALEVSAAIIMVPFDAMARRFQTPNLKGGMTAARQIHMETMAFALAHASPPDLVMLLRQQRDSLNGINLFILPEGGGAILREIAGESRSVPAYHFGYDPDTERYFRALYDGPNSVKSIRMGDGEMADFIENPSYRYSAKDTEPIQTLRTFPVLGEIIMQQPREAEDIAQGKIDPLELDVWVHNQTNTSLTIDPIRYVEGLKYCGLFNGNAVDAENGPGGDAGTAKHTPPFMSGLGTFGHDLTKSTSNDEWIRYAKESAYDNNTQNSKDMSARELSGMKNFRDQFPFYGIDTDGNAIAVPKHIGDLPIRTLPHKYIEAAAAAMAYGAQNILGMDIKALNVELMKPPGPRVGGGGGGDIYVPDAANVDALKTIVNYFIPGYDFTNRLGKMLVADTVAANAKKTTLYGRPAILQASRQAFASAATAERLLAAAEAKSLDLPAHYVRALSHVPDASMSQFLTFVHAAEQQLAASAADAAALAATEKAVNAVLTQLGEQSGKSAAQQLLATVAEHIEGNQPFAALAERTLLSTGVLKRSAPLEAGQLQFAHRFAAAAGHLDAMDIDAVPLGNAADTIGQYNANALNNASHFLKERIAYLQKNASHDLHAYLSLAIMTADNTYPTHRHLAQKLGVQLLRLNYIRPFQRYTMRCITAMKGGDRTLATAFGHSIVTPSLEGIEGYVNITVQFRAGVIPVSPDKMKLITYPICENLLSDINVSFVRNQAEFQSTDATKPSVVAMPVPIDETRYTFPMHATNKPIVETKQPFAKHSFAALYALLAGGIDYLDRQDNISDGADIYDMVHLSNVFHLGFAHYYKKRQGGFVSIVGNGPRGLANRNVPESAAVWAGRAEKFPQQVNISINA